VVTFGAVPSLSIPLTCRAIIVTDTGCKALVQVIDTINFGLFKIFALSIDTVVVVPGVLDIPFD
jgi:hypothetical protein